MVLVSVLLRSYNHEKYISEAIESILNQSFSDFELIIFDDFSKDSSRNIIENYQRRDKRIKAFFHEKNLGMASTMNDLRLKASGSYVAYVDSDDVWDRLKLEKQLSILNKNDSLIVWSDGAIIDQNSAPTGKMFTQISCASTRKKSGRLFEELLCGNFIFLSSLIHKRVIAEGIQFDEKLRYLNDYKFLVDLAKKREFYFMKEPLAKYRIHGKNSVSHDTKGLGQDHVIVFKYFLGEYSSEIPQRTKSILYFHLSRNYYSLNEKALAKFFFLQALKSNWVIHRLTYAIANSARYITSSISS